MAPPTASRLLALINLKRTMANAVREEAGPTTPVKIVNHRVYNSPWMVLAVRVRGLKRCLKHFGNLKAP